MIAMVSEALAEGFTLLGFETYVDVGSDDVEDVVAGLLRDKDRALVFIEHGMARAGSPMLARARREAGHVVITEIPPLHAPSDYRPPVEELVLRVLGPSALGERT